MTDIGVSWPGGFAHLVQNSVPSDMLEQLAVEAQTLADCPNFWVPKVKLVHYKLPASPTDARSLSIQETLSQIAMTTAEGVVAALYKSVVSAKLLQQCSGAEWWVQVLLTHTDTSICVPMLVVPDCLLSFVQRCCRAVQQKGQMSKSWDFSFSNA